MTQWQSIRRPRIFQIRPVEWMLAQGAVVVCAGGGGIPTMYKPGTRTLTGVEAVIDKDLASAVLAHDLRADLFVIATDTDAVYSGWGTPDQRAIASANPAEFATMDFPAGSMGPKAEAAIDFTRSTGRDAVIGALHDLSEIIAATAGTMGSPHVTGITYR